MNDAPAAAPSGDSRADPQPQLGASLDARADGVKDIFNEQGVRAFKALYQMDFSQTPEAISAYIEEHELPEELVREHVLDLLIREAQRCGTSMRDRAVANYPPVADLQRRPEVEQAAREAFGREILKNPAHAASFAEAFPLSRDTVMSTLRRAVSFDLRRAYSGKEFGQINSPEASMEILRAFTDFAEELRMDPMIRGAARAVLEELRGEQRRDTSTGEAFAQLFGLSVSA